MFAFPYLAATRPHSDAAELLGRFGIEAPSVAKARAEQSRRVGNHIHFCRWREVGRLLDVMGEERGSQTLH